MAGAVLWPTVVFGQGRKVGYGWLKEKKTNQKGECEAGQSVEGNGQGKRCSGLVSAWIWVGGQQLWMKRMRGELRLAAG